MDYHGDRISDEAVASLIQRVSNMAILFGAQKKISGVEFPVRVEPMPYTLFPSQLPAEVLEKTRRLHRHFQTLIYKVANDHEFMKDCLKDVLPVDVFTREFWNIYETVRNEGTAQPVALMLTRNDFMMEPRSDGGQAVKQVEFNTFASGAGGVIGAMTDIHRYSLRMAGFSFDNSQLPENRPTMGLARGMVKAWELYGNTSAAVLFVVGTPEPNTPDQHWLEKHIADINPSIKVVYQRFDQLMSAMKLGTEKELVVDGLEIAVVYYRYGYSPNHYPTSKEYNLRLQMERSKAVKCPSMAFHLAGCKKIQQVLAEDGVLERFLTDKDVIREIRSTFVGLYKLEQGAAIIDVALKTPEKFVLKPQREGGGNNHFDEDLRTFLTSIKDTTEVSSWILMDRIQAYLHRNRLIRVGLGPECGDVVSELGIFGVHVSTASKEIENFECGYLLRTKPLEANEAGLFSGLSCLDSPLVID